MQKKFKILKKKRTEKYDYVVAKEQPMSYATESLQKTIINLEYANVDKKYTTIQFTSTLMGEGKTTTLMNVAYLLQQRGKNVLIVDLDLRRPKIHQIFNNANTKGLNDYLLDNISKDELINKSNDFNLDYIVTGTKTDAISNVLNSKKLNELIKSLKEQYDYVLIDTPPVLAVSDSLTISSFVDGVIYIVSQDYALKKDVKDGVQTLRRTNPNIIGAIMTQVKVKGLKYYEYYE